MFKVGDKVRIKDLKDLPVNSNILDFVKPNSIGTVQYIRSNNNHLVAFNAEDSSCPNSPTWTVHESEMTLCSSKFTIDSLDWNRPFMLKITLLRNTYSEEYLRIIYNDNKTESKFCNLISLLGTNLVWESSRGTTSMDLNAWKKYFKGNKVQFIGYMDGK